MDGTEDLDFIIIGAGFSGICALIKILQKFPGSSVVLFERDGSVGGTWSRNTYPGLRCDIPSKLYSYSFALKSDWSSEFASQPEILAYIRGVVSSFNLSSNIHLLQTCERATWTNDKHHWRVHFIDESTGRRYIKRSRFLITAVGFCNVPNGAEDIQNVENFGGTVFHSSNWNHSINFRNKDIIVIGNGCSANQFIPYLMSEASVNSLTQVFRSGHWVAPKSNRSIHLLEKLVLNYVPGVNRLARLWIATKFDLALAAFKTSCLGNFFRKALQGSIASYMRRSAPSKYHEILIPEFDFGAKRPVLDHGYLSVLHDNRLTLLQSGSLTVTGPNELQGASGTKIHADIIILANGFKTQQPLTPMLIQGNGVTLPELWQQSGNFASAYMGVNVAGFPNLFLLTGPNTLPSGHSTLIGVECSVDYILRVINHAQVICGTLHGTRIEVKSAAQTRYNNWIQEKMEGFVYTQAVQNWYMDKRSGRNTLIWPGSQLSFWWSRCVKAPRWDDYDIKGIQT